MSWESLTNTFIVLFTKHYDGNPVYISLPKNTDLHFIVQILIEKKKMKFRCLGYFIYSFQNIRVICEYLCMNLALPDLVLTLYCLLIFNKIKYKLGCMVVWHFRLSYFEKVKLLLAIFENSCAVIIAYIKNSLEFPPISLNHTAA